MPSSATRPPGAIGVEAGLEQHLGSGVERRQREDRQPEGVEERQDHEHPVFRADAEEELGIEAVVERLAVGGAGRPWRFRWCPRCTSAASGPRGARARSRAGARGKPARPRRRRDRSRGWAAGRGEPVAASATAVRLVSWSSSRGRQSARSLGHLRSQVAGVQGDRDGPEPGGGEDRLQVGRAVPQEQRDAVATCHPHPAQPGRAASDPLLQGGVVEAAVGVGQGRLGGGDPGPPARASRRRCGGERSPGSSGKRAAGGRPGPMTTTGSRLRRERWARSSRAPGRSWVPLRVTRRPPQATLVGVDAVDPQRSQTEALVRRRGSPGGPSGPAARRGRAGASGGEPGSARSPGAGRGLRRSRLHGAGRGARPGGAPRRLPGCRGPRPPRPEGTRGRRRSGGRGGAGRAAGGAVSGRRGSTRRPCARPGGAGSVRACRRPPGSSATRPWRTWLASWVPCASPPAITRGTRPRPCCCGCCAARARTGSAASQSALPMDGGCGPCWAWAARSWRPTPRRWGSPGGRTAATAGGATPATGCAPTGSPGWPGPSTRNCSGRSPNWPKHRDGIPSGFTAGVESETHARFRREGRWLWIDTSAWQELPEALARRVARAALERAGVAREVERVHLERMLGLLANPRRGCVIQLPGGLSLQAEAGRARLGPLPSSGETVC